MATKCFCDCIISGQADAFLVVASKHCVLDVAVINCQSNFAKWLDYIPYGGF